MIDASLCEYEETVVRNVDGVREVTHYFLCPKDFMNESDFYQEESYGKVVGTCIGVSTTYDLLGLADEYEVGISVVVEVNGSVSDVDYREIFLDQNYTSETIAQLLDKVPALREDL